LKKPDARTTRVRCNVAPAGGNVFLAPAGVAPGPGAQRTGRANLALLLGRPATTAQS
jgi:hypothetical protein